MWNSIGSRVKQVIKQRVINAQKEHDDECVRLDEIRDNTIDVAVMTCENEKEVHADRMVNKVLGSITN